MAVKRSAEALDALHTRPRRDSSKRTKLAPSADERSNSSVPSSVSVSEDSALQSSPPASVRDRLSSMSSLASAESDDDSGRSVSTSSDDGDDHSEPDEQEDMVTIGGPKKPDMSRANATRGQADLKARIAALLPRLEQANNLLASEGKQCSMEEVEDGEQHIEMNLGLGILEQQREDDDGSSSEESGEGSEDDDEVHATDQPISGELKRSPKGKETHYLDALTGKQTEPVHGGIEEIG